MTTLEIVIWPDKVLETVSEEITRFDDDLARFAKNLTDTMYAANGLGLAANQVGVTKRVCVIDVADPETKKSNLVTLVNPEIVEAEGEHIGTEGCLSVPEFWPEIRRFAKVKVVARDVKGAPIEIVSDYEKDGIFTIALQHEIDHLNGIVFTKYLSALRRDMLRRKLVKRKREMAMEAAASRAGERSSGDA